MSAKNSKKSMSLRMEPELHDMLRAKAKAEGRSISWLVESAVNQVYSFDDSVGRQYLSE